MSKVKMQNQIYESYQREILYLQKLGYKLLQEIKQQEIKMNQKKQQNLKPHPRSLNLLNRMIKKLLRMLAFIKTYRYFQIINQPLSYNNETFFYQIASDYFNDLLQRFLLQVQLRLDSLVDFSISK